MALYRYVKSQPKKPHRAPAIFSFFFMASGLAMLLWAVWPILSFKLLTGQLFARIISPVEDTQKQPQVAFMPPQAVLAAAGPNGIDVAGVDYSNANTWYPLQPQKKISPTVTAYKITIPKLKISNALVIIAGEDLNKSLIHYGGTAFPGEYGNTVIFGHSTLPQLYDPKNYKSIFSTLPTLKIDDEIFVTYDGITYKYTVFEMEVTKPADLTALEQRFDDSYITLVTCVPPGTYWERLNVRARISSL